MQEIEIKVKNKDKLIQKFSKSAVSQKSFDSMDEKPCSRESYLRCWKSFVIRFNFTFSGNRDALARDKKKAIIRGQNTQRRKSV